MRHKRRLLSDELNDTKSASGSDQQWRLGAYLPLKISLTRSQKKKCDYDGCDGEQPLYRKVQQFRDGLVFEAHRLLCYSV